MSAVDLDRLLALAGDLARQAGQEILQHYQKELEIERKAGDEPVTQADRAAQEVILAGLRQQTPDFGILSEELEDKVSWSQKELAWVVDPLDGTKDFIAGREGFSVMIGLLRAFRPILGVVYQPVTGQLFQAAFGRGCTMIRDKEQLQLQTTGESEPTRLRLVASKSHRTAEIDQAKAALGINDELNVGSVGLKISLIARGERDLYLNPQGHSKLWDACAPEVLLSEAGGRMTDLYGDPIRYSPEELKLSRGIVASNGAAHRAVLAALAPLFPRPA